MTRFPDAAWRSHAGLPALLEAIGAHTGDTRLVGGFVRDTLLEIQTSDVDLATRLRPEDVVERVRSAGFKAVPTGIAHGTITAVLPSGPVEITTLRKDISTDGRRATIAYTDDWREDAARRDFTINALSADPETGQIHDYFGGLDDLRAGRVSFIGDPYTRIAEDHLRILRFFRFRARFGRGPADGAALEACIVRANDLMALSRERIADELIKLLALPAPAPTLRLMVEHAILKPVLPEIDGAGIARLAALEESERRASIVPAALRRLAALLPADPATVQAVAMRLKLSNAARKRLVLAAETDGTDNARGLAYAIGSQAAIDRLLLAGRCEAAAALVDWPVPVLPIGGDALLSLGLRGPAIAAALKQIKALWIAEGFPDAERVWAIARAITETDRPA